MRSFLKALKFRRNTFVLDRQDKSLILRNSFMSNIQLLKKNKGKKFCQRPCFLVIGSKNSGKSTLLRNCGLYYPTIGKEILSNKGRGGTTDCDWWFFDKAIFIEMPGRYVTEDESKLEWNEFLLLLKKQRRKVPIYGLIITISLEELILSPQKVERDILYLRGRMHQFITKYKLNVPVQIIFTAVDQIVGFKEFFSGFNEFDKNQIIGSSLIGINTHQARIQKFLGDLDLIYKRLSAIIGYVLPRIYDFDEKNQAVRFMYQFKRRFDPLKYAFELLSLNNSYQATLNVSGVWLAGEGYLTQELFKEIVTHYHKKEPRVYKKNRNLNVYRATAIGILVLPSSFLIYSHIENSNLLLEGDRKIEKLNRVLSLNSTFQEKIVAEMALYQYYEKLEQHKKHTPWKYRFSQYKAHVNLNLIEQCLIDSFNKTFVNLIIQKRELELRNTLLKWPSLNNSEKEEYKMRYYNALKQYLMFKFPQNLEVESLIDTVFLDFEKDLEEYNKKDLREWMAFYFNFIKEPKFNIKPFVFTLDDSLVVKARKHLSLSSGVEILNETLSRIKSEGRFKNLDLSYLISSFGRRWMENSRTLSSLYTVESWEKIVQPEIQRILNIKGRYDWVLDETFGSDFLKKLEIELRLSFFSMYRKEWKHFLSGISVQKFHDLNDAVSKLEELSSLDGPIAEMVQLVAKETQLIGIGSEKLVIEILNEYLSSLKSVQSEFNQILMSSNSTQELWRYAARILDPSSSGSVTGLQNCVAAVKKLMKIQKSEGLEQALLTLFNSPLQEAWRVVLNESMRGLQEEWNIQIVSLYRKLFEGKFPFYKSEIDAQLNDVSQFFHPEKGKLWKFIRNYLFIFITDEEGEWKSRSWMGISQRFSRDFLASLSHAKRISQSLFIDEKLDPNFKFEIYPKPSSNLNEFSLEMCDQVYRYRNEPEEWRVFEWPGIGSKNETRISAVSVDNNRTAQTSETGVWSLFRMMNNGIQKLNTKSNIYVSRWMLKPEMGESLYVTFMFRTNMPENPIEELIIKRFNLVGTLVDKELG